MKWFKISAADQRSRLATSYQARCAVPNPNCTSQRRRFFQVRSPFESPRLADHPVYLGLTHFRVPAARPDRDCFVGFPRERPAGRCRQSPQGRISRNRATQRVPQKVQVGYRLRHLLSLGFGSRPACRDWYSLIQHVGGTGTSPGATRQRRNRDPFGHLLLDHILDVLRPAPGNHRLDQRGCRQRTGIESGWKKRATPREPEWTDLLCTMDYYHRFTRCYSSCQATRGPGKRRGVKRQFGRGTPNDLGNWC